MKNIHPWLAIVISCCCCAPTFAVTIPTVLVGNPGNPADMRYVDARRPNGVGRVDYEFRIGKTEITNAQYVEFLNAVAATDTYGLYGRPQEFGQWDGIVRSGVPGSFTYAVRPAEMIVGGPLQGLIYSYDDKPVVKVNWGDAIRFVNWLHNGQPTGAQDSSTTEDGAYSLNGAVAVAGGRGSQQSRATLVRVGGCQAKANGTKRPITRTTVRPATTGTTRLGPIVCRTTITLHLTWEIQQITVR